MLRSVAPPPTRSPIFGLGRKSSPRVFTANTPKLVVSFLTGIGIKKAFAEHMVREGLLEIKAKPEDHKYLFILFASFGWEQGCNIDFKRPRVYAYLAQSPMIAAKGARLSEPNPEITITEAFWQKYKAVFTLLNVDYKSPVATIRQPHRFRLVG